MTFTAKDVQALRQATGSGMMDAKRALEESGGDVEKASELLREKGLADAAKRADRAQTEGTIGHYLHMQADRPVIGVLVELGAETDFVAKNPDFQKMARDIAMHVAAAQPRWVSREDVPEDIVSKERELIAAQARNENKPEDIVPRIVDGRIEAFYQDNVLYEQKFVKSEEFDGNVGDMLKAFAGSMGENIGVKQFCRVQVGGAS